MNIEQQAAQEKEMEKRNQQGEIFGRLLNGKTITDKEREILGPDLQLAAAKLEQTRNQNKLTQADRPIHPDQMNKIQEVRSNSDYEDASPAKKFQMLTDNGVSERNAKSESELYAEEEKNQTNALQQGYKSNEKYFNEITDSMKAANEMDMKLDQMLSLKDLPEPALAGAMEYFGIPPALFSADAETAEKLSIDLTKNIQQFYGSRILQSEFQAFMKSIPSLRNSTEGRKRIVENMKKFNDLRRLEYNKARALELDYESKKKPIPPDFRRRVYESMEKDASALADSFKNANQGRLNENSQNLPEGKVRVKTMKNGKSVIGTMPKGKIRRSNKKWGKF